MVSKLTQFAKKLGSHLSTAGTQYFRRALEPAPSNLVTGTLADHPPTHLLADVGVPYSP